MCALLFRMFARIRNDTQYIRIAVVDIERSAKSPITSVLGVSLGAFARENDVRPPTECHCSSTCQGLYADIHTRKDFHAYAISA